MTQVLGSNKFQYHLSASLIFTLYSVVIDMYTYFKALVDYVTQTNPPAENNQKTVKTLTVCA